MGKNTKIRSDLWKISLVIFCFVAVSVIGAGYVCAGDTPPAGSYTKTCKSIYYNASAGRITAASCKKMNGKWNTTQYTKVQQCINQGGDISNCDGSLDCTGVNVPSVGSFQKSCFCCKMVGTTLGCYCKPKKGTSKWTTLSNAANYSDIWNDNGKLKGQ